MRSSQPVQAPPEWILEPAAAWAYLIIVVALAFTPVFPLSWVLGIAATIVTYRERRAHGFPAFWWTVGVFVTGPLVYLFFVYKRPRGGVMFTPEAALSQQSRLVRGLPPKQVVPASADAPADWYPDPTGEARLRYWNGTGWTDHTAA